MRINKLLVTLGLVFSMLLSSGVVVAADFDKGLKAYKSGDYKAALAEWTPLAEQGDTSAQYNLGGDVQKWPRCLRERQDRSEVVHQSG